MNDAWMSQAACKGMTATMHPERGESTAPARRICAGCEVIDQCREWALVNNERLGVWGGMTERERRFARREMTVEARMKPIHRHWCSECGKPFETASRTAMTCSKSCRNTRFRRMQQEYRRVVA